MKAEYYVRSQHSVGSGSGRFGGPDTYVAVLWSEDDEAIFPKILNRKVIKQRGIHYQYMGEGYSCNRGPRSALGAAISNAQSRVNFLLKVANG